MTGFIDYCRDAGADVDAVRRSDRSRDAIAARWYSSLRAGQPAYDIYDADEYLAEAWACWTAYSSRYLKLMARSPIRNLRPRTVVDLGCGIGWSTGALTRMYPDAVVYGTNRLGSTQARVAELFAKGQGLDFRLVEDPTEIGHADLVFASEYFEHFAAPVDHLREILGALTPSVLLTASTFTQPAPGHFPAYVVDGERLPGAATSRRFNAHLRAVGYERMPMRRFWNDRPACWQLGDPGCRVENLET